MKPSPPNPDTVTLSQWLAAAALWAFAAYGLLAPPEPGSSVSLAQAAGCLTVR
ncbi:MAG: hypothetical protein Q7J28_16265 [Caulobacter sp.]|nr:hypothetical protein [Caulobacter sp.]